MSNIVVRQLLQWPPTVSTIIGIVLLMFGVDYLLTGNVTLATGLAGIFATLVPEAKPFIEEIEKEISNEPKS